MAKNVYNYFDLKAQADKKSRGEFILDLGPDVERVVVAPITVRKAVDADPSMNALRQLEYALGAEQWERLLGVVGDEEMTVLNEISQAFYQHFYGKTEGVPGGNAQ
ncbi:hypothetical protein P9990_17545 [Prescottella equi]|uniref:hypothetical protein n=1 Tax=Rhodococcus hoagii TaxID=43767 RepID=UPI0025776A1E|nr:hypothetical protein [Prescottella equi]WJJ10376.1 hypothetical protein P9990_17545 [Prescottella equi]